MTAIYRRSGLLQRLAQTRRPFWVRNPPWLHQTQPNIHTPPRPHFRCRTHLLPYSIKGQRPGHIPAQVKERSDAGLGRHLIFHQGLKARNIHSPARTGITSLGWSCEQCSGGIVHGGVTLSGFILCAIETQGLLATLVAPWANLCRAFGAASPSRFYLISCHSQLPVTGGHKSNAPST